MQKLQFLYNISRRQWILLLCLMLIAYLARFALAQDDVVPVEPAAEEIVIEPVPLIDAPVEPTQIVADPLPVIDAPVEPTQVLEVIASSEAVMDATTLPDVQLSATPADPVATTIPAETLMPTVLIPVVESTVEPVVMDAVTVTPVVLVEIQPTPLPVDMPPVIEASPIIPIMEMPPLPSHLSGRIQAALAGTNATVTIAGINSEQTVAVQSDGSFALDVLPGDYQVIITAQYHLPYVVEVSLTDPVMVLPPITLINNQMGGELVLLIVQNFGLSGSSPADVNGDGIVNVYDLAIAGSSFR